MGVNYYNRERYSDPTAFVALSRILREEKAAKKQHIDRTRAKQGSEENDGTAEQNGSLSKPGVRNSNAGGAGLERSHENLEKKAGVSGGNKAHERL